MTTQPTSRAEELEVFFMEAIAYLENSLEELRKRFPELLEEKGD